VTYKTDFKAGRRVLVEKCKPEELHNGDGIVFNDPYRLTGRRSRHSAGCATSCTFGEFQTDSRIQASHPMHESIRS